ncbi:MAG: 50S ribosomal protein L30 [Calditrichaeota bacterium]|nr:MAG: 50S ribosomal protein L30 [Calditrichota bacterium]
MAKAKHKKVKVTLVKSPIGRHYKQKRTLEALGLRRLHRSVIHEVSPSVEGMLNKVSHLVTVEPAEK